MIKASPKTNKQKSRGIPKNPRHPIDFRHPQASFPLSFCFIIRVSSSFEQPFKLAIRMLCTSVIASCKSGGVTRKLLEEQLMTILVFNLSISDTVTLNVGVSIPLGRENT